MGPICYMYYEKRPRRLEICAAGDKMQIYAMPVHVDWYLPKGKMFIWDGKFIVHPESWTRLRNTIIWRRRREIRRNARKRIASKGWR